MNAPAIKAHMGVIASDGQKIGQLDHMEAATRSSSPGTMPPDGQYHLIPLNWVSKIDQHVRLHKAAKDVKAQWSEVA